MNTYKEKFKDDAFIQELDDKNIELHSKVIHYPFCIGCKKDIKSARCFVKDVGWVCVECKKRL